MLPYFFEKHRYKLGTLIIAFAIIIYKFKFLFLPYYWDEAWPYATAVNKMYEHGLSLMPGSIPVIVSRGHPLVFHCLAAAWMKIFGAGLFPVHCFALFIAVALVVAIYAFCATFFSERVAFVACLLFAAQGAFIAQAAFLLPEMLMALWTLLCFYAFFKNKTVLFIVLSALMLLTKESAAIFFLTIFLTEIIRYAALPEKDLLKLFKTFSILAIPVAIASVFFMLQKIKFGWFLYPLHVDYAKSGIKAFTRVLPDVVAYLCIYDGRNGISGFVLASVVFLLVKKAKLEPKEKNMVFTLTIYIVLYLAFSSINFYIPRYILCVFPPFIIVSIFLMDRALAGQTVIYSLIISGLLATSLFFYFHPKKQGDMDYSAVVSTKLSIIHYCESLHLQDSHIFTTSVLRDAFTNPYAGYLSAGKFNNIQWQFSPDTDYCVFCSDEYNEKQFAEINRNHLELVQLFEQKNARCELYKVIR